MFTQLFPMDWQGIAAMVELLLLCGLILDAIRNRREAKFQRRSERYTLYIYFWEKFDKISSELPLDVFKADFQCKSEEEHQRLLVSLRGYFDLCAQEFFMHTQDALDEEVWELWAGGMLHCMRLPVFQEAYDKLEVKMSYPEFHGWIQSELKRVEQASH